MTSNDCLTRPQIADISKRMGRMDLESQSKRRRPQFSLKLVLLLVGVFAIGGWVWQTYFAKHPTYSISAYEQARSYHGRTARIGPNQITLKSVARNDRDGTLLVESGRGEPVDAAIPGRQVMIDCADWLDVAQLELQPGTDAVEILEARIFDHQSRERLDQQDASYGWRVTSSNLVQLFGLGKQLPQQVDVWLCVYSDLPADPVEVLKPTIGQAVSVDGCEIKVADAQAGFVGWSSADGLVPLEGRHHADCALEFVVRGGEATQHCRVVAVTHDGKRFNGSNPLASGLHNGPRSARQMAYFRTPLESVKYLEIRPTSPRHRFFFDGVQLPEPTSIAGFAAPPKPVLKIQGTEISTNVSEFRPLKFDLKTVDGDCSMGSTGGPYHLQLLPYPDGPQDRGNCFSLILDVEGVCSRTVGFRFRTSGTPAWKPASQLQPMGGSSSFRGATWLSQSLFRVPLDTIDEIEFTLP